MYYVSMLMTHTAVDSHSAELHNVDKWALANNLELNLTISREISQFVIKSHPSTSADRQNSWRHIYQ